MKFFYSDEGKTLSDSLDCVEHWDLSNTQHTVRHIPSNLVFWVGNGAWFFDGYENYYNKNAPILELGLVERHFLYRKYKKMIKKTKKERNKNAVEMMRNSCKDST